MEQEERIQQYLSGNLSEDAQKEFEKELSTNESLKKEFNEFKDVQEAFKIVEAAQLKNRFEQLEQKRVPFYKKMFHNKFRNLAYASVAVIGLFLVLNTNTSNESLYASYYESYPNVHQPITRGDNETEATLAFQLYENNNFKDAELEFEKLLALEENSHYRFYYAQCLLQNKKSDKALLEFEGLKTIKQDYTSEIYWYTALIQLQKNNVIDARTNLKALIELNSNFKKKEAKEILSEID